MAQLMDYAHYLAKEIGPRPAGTEEEQQAALYITERFQKDAGFTANIEEFSSASNPDAGRAVLALIAIVATILSMIFQVLAIPAFLLTLAATVVYVAEMLDRPLVSRLLSRGASQNVLAKYQPNSDLEPSPRGRTRKIVLVAHYDTGRVTPPLVERLESLNVPWSILVIAAMALATLLLLVRIVIAAAGGIGLIILNLLSVVALLVCALPVVKAVLVRRAPYNEGANNNATGTAALIEIARRISRGSVSEADLAGEADGITIHGASAAYAEGLVPDGAQLRYEAAELVPSPTFGEHDETDRLIAAKAAIAAMTGKPVERKLYGSVAGNLVNTHFPEGADENIMPDGLAAPELSSGASDGAFAGVAGSVGVADVRESATASSENVYGVDLPADAEGFQNAPSWFIAAQQNAKRNSPDGAGTSEGATQVQRSKYTEAMEHAERGIAEREIAQAEAAQIGRAAEQKAREDEARESLEAARVGAVVAEAGEADGADGAESPAAAPVVVPVIEPDPAPARPSVKRELPVLEPTVVPDPTAERAAVSASAAQNARTRGAGVDAIFGEGAGQEGPITSNANDPAATIAHTPVPMTRRAIDLPEVDRGSVTQREPRRGSASERPTSPGAATAQDAPASAQHDPSRASKLQKLRTDVPSLSGLIDPVKPEDVKAQARRSVVNVPSPAEPTPRPSAASRAAAGASAKPVASAKSAAPSESIDYDMEVPTSRAGSLLNKLRGRGGSDLEETPQEWLNVDEDFDARSVGRKRGSWESFRTDLDSTDEDDGFGSFGTGDDDHPRRWQGGAYSRLQLGHVDMRSGEDAPADEMIPDEPPETEVGRNITGEIERIYHFRNPQFNTEIWFVAIGSDNEAHSGARAFLAEHADELRGSMVIEVESLGYGSLSVAKEEGRLRKVTASSRIKRYTRNATQATGIALDEVSLVGSESIASVVQKAGFQSMHLFGATDGRPAMKGSADDVMENIEELLFDEHVNYVFELLKS